MMKRQKRKAFTMIELVFVIVVLGILASIAVSKMAVTRDDAMFVKGKSQVAAIRNALTLVRNTNMLQARGSAWPTALDDAAAGTIGAEIFDGNDTIGQLLDYPLYSTDKNGYWQKIAANRYSFKVMNVDVNFTYNEDNAGNPENNGRFQCTQGAVNTTVLRERYCQILTR